LISLRKLLIRKEGQFCQGMQGGTPGQGLKLLHRLKSSIPGNLTIATKQNMAV
jgi:hypothetical protein